MAYVKVPKDLSAIKSKVILNLTKRQLICFLIGGILGIGGYALLKDVISYEIASILMIFLMVPFFIFALYERDGRYLERIIFNVFVTKVLRPKRRVYRKGGYHEDK